jgi:hypothetical protein
MLKWLFVTPFLTLVSYTVLEIGVALPFEFPGFP